MLIEESDKETSDAAREISGLKYPVDVEVILLENVGSLMKNGCDHNGI